MKVLVKNLSNGTSKGYKSLAEAKRKGVLKTHTRIDDADYCNSNDIAVFTHGTKPIPVNLLKGY